MRKTIRQGWLMPIAAAIPMIILSLAVLSILLAGAANLHLSTDETASWILAVYGLPALVSLILANRYRQPLMFTGNVFVLLFIVSLGHDLSYPELVGAAMVAGALAVLLNMLGLTHQLSALIPVPVVLGLLAGAVMPFVSGIFTSLGAWPAPIGVALLAYFWGRRRLGSRVPPLLPALVAALAVAALQGDLGQGEASLSLYHPVFTAPVFTVKGIVTATPVFVVMLTLQSNIPSFIFLRHQGYDAPERTITTVSGLGTVLFSLLGPIGLSLSLPATSLVAGPEAGPREFRYRAAYIASSMMALIGILAHTAADIPALIPMPLLLAFAGLATFGVLANALQQITRGPLLIGPLFAFAIALSNISLLGLGPFFWSLAIGTGVSFWLEREEWRALRAAAAA